MSYEAAAKYMKKLKTFASKWMKRTRYDEWKNMSKNKLLSEKITLFQSRSKFSFAQMNLFSTYKQ